MRVMYEIERSMSKAMREAITIAERVAPSNLTVIISGEPGTGKEWVAHLIHNISAGSHGPFHAIDCSALPSDQVEKEIFGFESLTWQGVEVKRSAFEEAAGGTLFFQDFDSQPDALQLKIARALEYQQYRRIGGTQANAVGCRVIVGIRDTASAPKPMLPSSDAFATHVTAIRIELPPLRKRREDIPLLIRKILDELHDRYGHRVEGMSAEAVELCTLYDWPGNVRQLKNVVEYGSIMSKGELILPKHLPDVVQLGVAGEGNGSQQQRF